MDPETHSALPHDLLRRIVVRVVLQNQLRCDKMVQKLPSGTSVQKRIRPWQRFSLFRLFGRDLNRSFSRKNCRGKKGPCWAGFKANCHTLEPAACAVGSGCPPQAVSCETSVSFGVQCAPNSAWSMRGVPVCQTGTKSTVNHRIPTHTKGPTLSLGH